MAFAVIYDTMDDMGDEFEEYYGYFESPGEAARIFRETFPVGETYNERLVLILQPIDSYLNREKTCTQT